MVTADTTARCRCGHLMYVHRERAVRGVDSGPKGSCMHSECLCGYDGPRKHCGKRFVRKAR